MNNLNVQYLQNLSTNDLIEIENKFPFFLLPKMIRLKKYLIEKHPDYQPLLHKTAIYSYRREALFEFLHDSKTTIVSSSDKTVQLFEVLPIASPTTIQPTVIPTPIEEKVVKLDAENISSQKTEEPISQINKKVEPIELPVIPIREIEETIFNNLKDILESNIVEKEKIIAETEIKNTSEDIAIEASENSFMQWLKIVEKNKNATTKTNPSETIIKERKKIELPEREEKIKVKKDPELDALDGFVRDQIKRKKKKNTSIIEIPFQQIIEKSTDSNDMISEGLAQLLKTQGKYERAIDMYQKLISKNPEKSTFFASQIELIKDLNR